MKKIRFIVGFILFNTALVISLILANYVLRNKDYSGAQDRFKRWKPEKADIIFVGNSHQFCTINPDILYEDYGIESFMLATSAQTIPMSYYGVMEAIELRHPDTIVFEVAFAANDIKIVGSGMDHCFFDGMPLCKARREGLKDLVSDEERIYFQLPLGLYHVRWKETKPSDYEMPALSERGEFVRTDIFPNWEIPLVEPDEYEPMAPEMEDYYLKLINLCKDNGVKLIVYCAPFAPLYEDEESKEDLLRRERVFNYALKLAEEHGCPTYNMFYEIDEIGLDMATDWSDSQHLNYSGQEKFTRYMVENGYLE